MREARSILPGKSRPVNRYRSRRPERAAAAAAALPSMCRTGRSRHRRCGTHHGDRADVELATAVCVHMAKRRRVKALLVASVSALIVERRRDVRHVDRPRRSPGANLARRRMCWADRCDALTDKGFRMRCRLNKHAFHELLALLLPAIKPKSVAGRGANQAGHYQIKPPLRLAVALRHLAGASACTPTPTQHPRTLLPCHAVHALPCPCRPCRLAHATWRDATWSARAPPCAPVHVHVCVHVCACNPAPPPPKVCLIRVYCTVPLPPPLAGAAVWDNADLHGLSENSVYDVLWQLVDAINAHPALAPKFDPGDVAMMDQLRDGFASVSTASRFSGAVLAVDGLMIGIKAPSMKKDGVKNAKRCHCQRKGGVGLFVWLARTPRRGGWGGGGWGVARAHARTSTPRTTRL